MAAGSLGCLSSPGRALARGLLDNLRAADGVADERLRRVLINAQMSGFGG